MKLTLRGLLLILLVLLLTIKIAVLYRSRALTSSPQEVSESEQHRVDEEIRKQLDDEAQEHFNQSSDFSSFPEDEEFESSVFSF